jgi:hypothetical protein
LVALNQNFEIPPHNPNFQVEGSLAQVPQTAMMLGLSPHMHYRGKSFQLTAVRAGESESNQIILDVPRYDFNWQHVYAFSKPLLLDGISRIDFVAAFDNSVDNPANPDPSRTVTWGDQSWEEMAIVYFDVAWRIRPDEAEAQPSTATDLSEESTSNGLTTTVPKAAGTEAQVTADQATETGETISHDEVAIQEQVDQFFGRFAPTGRDRIPEESLPEAIRRFADLDHDNDGEISRDELRKAFVKRAERQRRRANE